MINLIMKKLDPKFTKRVYDSLMKEKKTWKKDLNYVKAMTSGFHPDKKYYYELADFIIKFLKEEYNEDYFLSCWWANFYKKGQFAEKHHHKPEMVSAIFVVKSSKYNPITFYDKHENKIKIVEQDGLLMLFSSNLPHSVDICKENRLSLALDFNLKK